MLIEITYISRATIPFSAEELLALLQQCRRNNTKAGITGMLLYGNDTFLQSLEGDETTLDALVEKIGKDPRHTEIQVLRRKPISQRQYSDWSMGFKRISDGDLERIDGLRAFGGQKAAAQTSTLHNDVVHSLMDYWRLPYSAEDARELDERTQTIEHLEVSLAQLKNSVETACLVFESLIDASRVGALNEGHIELCRTALTALKQERT